MEYSDEIKKFICKNTEKEVLEKQDSKQSVSSKNEFNDIRFKEYTS